jgi:hypothetical protein
MSIIQLKIRNVIPKALSIIIFSACVILFISILYNDASAQSANPANWLYPDGNSQATKYTSKKSARQSIDSMTIKWSTRAIFGDIVPLVGNIILNPKLRTTFPYSPNEMVAMVEDSIVVVDGSGKVRRSLELSGNGFPYVKNISVLFDTTKTELGDPSGKQVWMGLETIEHSRTKVTSGNRADTLAVAYLARFNPSSERPEITKRIAIDMRDFSPNFSASIKPVYGYSNDGKVSVFAQVNTALPTFDPNETNPDSPPFFRGMIQFDANTTVDEFQIETYGYDEKNIYTLGPEISGKSPSIANLVNPGSSKKFLTMSLPIFPDRRIPGLEMPNRTSSENRMVTDLPYLSRLLFTGTEVQANIRDEIRDFTDAPHPKLRPLHIELFDPDSPNSPPRPFLLMSESYSGLATGSTGTSYLHLFDGIDGNAETATALVRPLNTDQRPYKGLMNGAWSVAVGNLDGNYTGNNINEKLPYFPNNHGVEIIATNSSRDFVVANSKIHVLKYNGLIQSKRPPKKDIPNQTLNLLDTICTHRVNGWVAAVNDIDGDPSNGKDEVLIVSGSTIMVLQMRDYDTKEFWDGNTFDTLLTETFPNETISSAIIADIEGDGKNDIIVTTFLRTYVVGIPLKSTLEITEPVESKREICAGEEIIIKWKNLVVSDDDFVRILFQETDDAGTIISPALLIADSLSNSDTYLEYTYTASDNTLGKVGYFIVESIKSQGKLKDISGLQRFNEPSINIIDIDNLPDTLTVGENITLEAITYCNDSLAIEFKTYSGTWTNFYTEYSSNSGTTTISTQVPCLDIYECYSSQSFNTVDFRLVTFQAEFQGISEEFSLTILPAEIPFEIMPQESADPSKEFVFDVFGAEFECDSLSLMYSLNNGASFTLIETIDAVNNDTYIWSIPLGLPDSVLFRACCGNSCAISDTIITGMRATNIKIIAPNPFRPPFETLDIVYTVSETTNVTVTIYDNNNRIVAIPISGELREYDRVYADKWDGRMTNGNLVANGLYYIKVEESSGRSEIYPLFVRK